MSQQPLTNAFAPSTDYNLRAFERVAIAPTFPVQSATVGKTFTATVVKLLAWFGPNGEQSCAIELSVTVPRKHDMAVQMAHTESWNILSDEGEAARVVLSMLSESDHASLVAATYAGPSGDPSAKGWWTTAITPTEQTVMSLRIVAGRTKTGDARNNTRLEKSLTDLVL